MLMHSKFVFGLGSVSCLGSDDMRVKHWRFLCTGIQALIWLIVSLLCLSVGEVEPAKGEELKLASWASPGSPMAVSVLEFANAVYKGTGGRLSITVVDGREIGNIAECLNMVKSGVVDGALAPHSIIEGVYPRFRVLSFPFVFFDEKHVDNAIYGQVGVTLLKRFSEAAGVKSVCFLENGFRDLAGRGKAVKTVADLKGLSVSLPSRGSFPSFAALGANPKLLTPKETVMALKSKAVEMADVMIFSGFVGDASLAVYKDVMEYVSLTQHSYFTSILVFNLQKFNGLSDVDRDVVLGNAVRASELNKSLVRNGRERSIAKLAEEQISVVEPDRVGMRESLSSIFRDPPQEINRGDLEQIKKACRWPPFCSSNKKKEKRE
jgi:TRAP-type C4-dicarboxylate transport system substrate-binding protein